MLSLPSGSLLRKEADRTHVTSLEGSATRSLAVSVRTGAASPMGPGVDARDAVVRATVFRPAGKPTTDRRRRLGLALGRRRPAPETRPFGHPGRRLLTSPSARMADLAPAARLRRRHDRRLGIRRSADSGRPGCIHPSAARSRSPAYGCGRDALLTTGTRRRDAGLGIPVEGARWAALPPPRPLRWRSDRSRARTLDPDRRRGRRSRTGLGAPTSVSLFPMIRARQLGIGAMAVQPGRLDHRDRQ